MEERPVEGEAITGSKSMVYIGKAAAKKNCSASVKRIMLNGIEGVEG